MNCFVKRNVQEGVLKFKFVGSLENGGVRMDSADGDLLMIRSEE